jgi:protein phosphatase
VIHTRYGSGVKIREEQAAAAFEVMNRYTVDPRWLIHLPPTMAPVDTSPLPDFLEHPAEAFRYYLAQGVDEVVCQRKHMGSRALVIVGKSPRLLADRFQLAGPAIGRILTRTGRPFFADAEWEAALLSRVQHALTTAEFWRHQETDWVLLDCELLPWSAKAQTLLEGQYAAVGAAGELGLAFANEALARAAARGIDLDGLAERTTARLDNIRRFRAAYRPYCWPTRHVTELRLAPFHILATEGQVHVDRDHRWHLDSIADFCRHDEVLLTTEHRFVDLTDAAAQAAAIDWWLAQTQAGGEGMVVKPVEFLHRTERGLTQPALKVRGREYLRIVYGPDYLEPDNLARLKKRRVGKKRSLAIREFSLGLEALDRFVAREPLGRVHRCVFGILALEREGVDGAL